MGWQMHFPGQSFWNGFNPAYLWLEGRHFSAVGFAIIYLCIIALVWFLMARFLKLVAGRRPKYRCPVDGRTMSSISDDDELTYHRCEICSFTLFSPEELQALIQYVYDNAHPPDREVM
jgi:hypothetical protein